MSEENDGAGDVNRYYWFPAIRRHAAGDDLGWFAGPVYETGWYIDPYCHPQCCRPKGPFRSYAEALRYSRANLIELQYGIPDVTPGHA